ncbi:MAG: hypothetical protein HC775_11580 [Hyellaceae cyanobacterium CSU_1_1]|nr:hypothetical protein [Pleurocapsa sp. CRU_1_2]NJR46363.1 hypothetical protein [Hyellaceae cyanobacterium CSU_1_1]
MPQLPVIAEHIELTPGVCGGKPRIAERGIVFCSQGNKSNNFLHEYDI